jgi:hypothetical protein
MITFPAVFPRFPRIHNRGGAQNDTLGVLNFLDEDKKFRISMISGGLKRKRKNLSRPPDLSDYLQYSMPSTVTARSE